MAQIAQFEKESSSGGPVTIGSAYYGFETKIVPASARSSMKDDCVAILSRCATVGGAESITGLVVGQVQSGKTMSYEGLICMAHDSAIPVVIVVSGISTPLQEQGFTRLTSDLGVASDKSWHFLKNPKQGDANSLGVLESVARDWSDPDIPIARRRTAVISVLKNHNHLHNLTDLLGKIDWSSWPVLIIDDEADQASLDTRVRRPGSSSTTYSVLMQLRQVFPTFSYIQYTATPQAPLLINIADALSPAFVRVLEPGKGYVGGERLFAKQNHNVAAIPQPDIDSASSNPIDPPTSLVKAMQVFFLGLAYALSDPDFNDPRSMLIHPSQGTDAHSRFSAWASALKNAWWAIVDQRDTMPEDFDELVAEFEDARTDLLRTTPGLAEIRDIAPSLKLALSRTHVITMNAVRGRTPEVPWDDFDGFVLVGGQALDRGFTVKGLTVTYMPRDPGVGNADTVQQRARFFGYKADYLGFCRVYLEPDLLKAFRNYVDHETDIRRRLKEIQRTDAPLKSWRRAFVLDPTLKPTRQSVQQLGSLQDQFSDNWYWDNRPSLEEAWLERARDVREQIRRLGTFHLQHEHSAGTPSQRYAVARDISLKIVVEELSNLSVVDEANSLQYTGLLVQLERALEENPGELCDMYMMRPDISTVRSLTPKGAISELFQGASQRSHAWKKGEIYAGDRAVMTSERVSVQIHSIDVKQDTEIIAADVPIVAVWVPNRLATGWFVQKS